MHLIRLSLKNILDSPTSNVFRTLTSSCICTKSSTTKTFYISCCYGIPPPPQAQEPQILNDNPAFPQPPKKTLEFKDRSCSTCEEDALACVLRLLTCFWQLVVCQELCCLVPLLFPFCGFFFRPQTITGSLPKRQRAIPTLTPKKIHSRRNKTWGKKTKVNCSTVSFPKGQWTVCSLSCLTQTVEGNTQLSAIFYHLWYIGCAREG